MDEDSDNSQDNEALLEKQAIQAEINEVDAIIQLAKSITHNAKISALKKALTTAFDYQISNGMEEKVVVFTESKRTQSVSVFCSDEHCIFYKYSSPEKRMQFLNVIVWIPQ